MTSSSTVITWLGVLLLSVACDVGATAYLKLAGDRIDGIGFFGVTVLGIVVFAPSIIAFGYGMKIGPSYIATVGIWAVGVCVANAIIGVAVFGDSVDLRTVIGVASACVAITLLKPA